MTTIAIYPGSFDPVTNGHLDIIIRAAKFVDKLIVSVSGNLNKNSVFSVSERVELLKKVTNDISNVEIDSMDGLLVNYVKEKEAKLIIKGLRAVSDFEYEFLMALINRNLESDIETLFLPASTQYQYLSSSVVKEVAFYGGNIDGLVPKEIQSIITDKICNKKYLE